MGGRAFQSHRGEPVPSLRSALEDVRAGQHSPLSAGCISGAGGIPRERALPWTLTPSGSFRELNIVLTEAC